MGFMVLSLSLCSASVPGTVIVEIIHCSPCKVKTANRKGQADKVIEFIKADSELAKDVNKHYAVVK